ncbi:MAG: hypothetical protein WA194_02240 [Patescibacteria group bacterium]
MPFEFLVHEAVLDCVPHQQVSEHTPQAEYPHVPVSQEQDDQEGTDHAFATHEDPLSEYPLSQERDSDAKENEPQTHVTAAFEEPFAMGLETVAETPSANQGIK